MSDPSTSSGTGVGSGTGVDPVPDASITFENVSVGSGLGAAVQPLTLTISSGEPTVIAVEGDERPLLVSMLLGGRMHPDAGRVTTDGTEDADGLRRRTAVVDTPFVAEPPAGISLASVVAEEFSFAGRPTSRRAVDGFLSQHGLIDYAALPMRALPARDRVRLFSELALLRDDVDTLIITSPERHGDDPAGWYSTLAAIAERGVTVAVVTDIATRDILIGLGARDAFAHATAAPQAAHRNSPKNAPKAAQK
jgi:ABC-2 type transport system ATP-binding protein